MKRTPERIESLAAEYVLGSLKGRARQRFERWMMQSVTVRQEVWFWEERLGQLVQAVPSVTPDQSVWAGIEQRLWPVPTTLARQKVSWLWPGWSFLATAAALVLAVILIFPALDDEAPRTQLTGAVVQSDVADPLWLVSEAAERNQLRLRSVAVVQAERGKDYELWVVPVEGNPLSLGVMAVGDVYEVTLSEEARRLLSSSRTLAISLEPRGGSSTGAPTGPILHVTRLYEM